MQTACPCCGSVEFYPVLTFPSTPVTGVYLSNPTHIFRLGDFGVGVCEQCGLLRQQSLTMTADYTVKPRSTDRQLPSYKDELMRVIGNAAQQADLIVEIGSNDGTFLKLLDECGYRNTFGVEPSVELAEKSRQKGLRIESGYFGKQIVKTLIQAYGAARLIICRHTLEHIPEPSAFICAIRDLLAPGGSVLIEVPDSSAIAEGVNFVELWDEHLYYFTINTLGNFLMRHGLVIKYAKSFPHLDTRNLLVQATIRDMRDACAFSIVEPIDDWRSFSKKFAQLSKKLRDQIKQLPRPVYLVGASHPQCNFVNYLDLGGSVDFMIDDDPEKAGKIPPIKGGDIGIMTTLEFAKCSPAGAVVLTGFGYPGWSRRIVEIAKTKNMSIFDPRACVE